MSFLKGHIKKSSWLSLILLSWCSFGSPTQQIFLLLGAITQRQEFPSNKRLQDCYPFIYSPNKILLTYVWRTAGPNMRAWNSYTIRNLSKCTPVNWYALSIGPKWLAINQQLIRANCQWQTHTHTYIQPPREWIHMSPETCPPYPSRLVPSTQTKCGRDVFNYRCKAAHTGAHFARRHTTIVILIMIIIIIIILFNIRCAGPKSPKSHFRGGRRGVIRFRVHHLRWGGA